MDFLNDLAFDLLAGLAYGALGLVLLAVGYWVIDLLTPGRLSDLIYRDRNWNAAAVAASGLVAVATILVTAIITSHDDLDQGLAYSATFGALGVILLAISFLVVDKLTPGDLGEIVCDPERHPAVVVTVVTHIAVGAIVAAAIS